MTNDRLIVTPSGDLPAVDDPKNLLDAIGRAVADPRMDVEKMSKLFDLHQRIVADQRAQSFKAALARLQASVPMIDKDARVLNADGSLRYRYSKVETIHEILQPLLAAEGFAIAFNEEENLARAERRYSCTLSHRDGHSETKYKTLPLDSSGHKNPIQSEGSTTSYARRYLIKMHLNIVEKGEDDDGSGGAEKISMDEALNIQALLEEVKANKARFLTFMGVAKIEDILRRDYKKAITAIEERRSKISHSDDTKA